MDLRSMVRGYGLDSSSSGQGPTNTIMNPRVLSRKRTSGTASL